MMKFDKKGSKLLKNTKKVVYVSAITGVLLTGTQVGQFAPTYSVHADETGQTSKVVITFVNQFGSQIEKPADGNEFSLASYAYQVQPVKVNRDQILSTLASFPGISKDTNDVPDALDMSKAGNYTFHLTQPTHRLTINLVDQNGNIVYTEVKPEVTQYTQTSTKELSEWAQSNRYSYTDFPATVDNGLTTFNISVIAPTTVQKAEQQNNSTSESNTKPTTTTNTQPTSDASSTPGQSSSSAQSSSSSDDKKESASVSESTKTVEQSSAATTTVQQSGEVTQSSQSSDSTEQSSAATQNVKSEAASSVATSENASSTTATSTESSAQSSTASSSASQAPKSNEKTMVIVDPANKGEAKKAAAKETKQTPVAEKKDVRAKLPQTGDNTNQARAIALGVATIALGLGLAYFGLRRKNK
ncbi:LPXTG cell wall anchor domain-containing protein [Apilactobacillus sp. 1-1-2]|uniref:LPXTG cell wall anchor domain-containing protein n=1 Tax=Apilactobacillus sp. 1-1-2 TaxID=3411035 RepID=UPI003B93AF21